MSSKTAIIEVPPVQHIEGEMTTTNQTGQDIITWGKCKMVQYIYQKEDLLYKVLYDKIYRKDLFNYITE